MRSIQSDDLTLYSRIHSRSCFKCAVQLTEHCLRADRLAARIERLRFCPLSLRSCRLNVHCDDQKFLELPN